MKSLERLISILNDTKLYKLNKNSIITAELTTYALIIEDIYKNINQLLDDIFFTDKMSSYAEYMYDHLFRIGNPLISLDDRIKLYSKRMQISKKYYTLEDTISAIASGGLKVSFTELDDNKALIINVLEDIGVFETREQREKFIKLFIPPYCRTIFIHNI